MCKIHISLRRPRFFFIAALVCAWLLLPAASFAQQTTSGTIKDAGGRPLPGATITVKGTSATTATDANGNFSISVPDSKSILVIRYVGYATQEIVVGSRTSFDIAMAAGAGELNQVVVVGYGTQNKKDVTGSIKSVKSDAFNRGIITSPQQLLQGKVPGVTVT